MRGERIAEDGGATGGGHFGIDLFIGEGDCIIIWMRDFSVVREPCCPLLWCKVLNACAFESPSFGGDRGGLHHQCERPIVLRASAHEPMAVAKTLKQRIVVIERSHTLLLCGACLRCPEVHAERHEYRRNGLPPLFGVLAEETRRLCFTRSRAGEGVEFVEHPADEGLPVVGKRLATSLGRSRQTYGQCHCQLPGSQYNIRHSSHFSSIWFVTNVL